MASPRSSSSSGRTPPFILVGLIVLVCFLAYNYWSLSSQNSELMGELEAIRLKARDVSDENKQNKESLDSVRVELSKAKLSIESHRAQANQWSKEKGDLNEQISTKNSEVDTCKQALETCNENQKTEQEAKLAAEAEKETLQTQLQALKDQPKTCDKAACTGPVREVVVVAAKLTGTNSLGNALAQAGFDAAQLLEGINIPAPQSAAQEAKPAAPVEAQASAAEAAAPEAAAAEAAAPEAAAPEAAAPEAVAPANPVNESAQANEAVQANESVQAQDGSAPEEAQAPMGGQEAALQAADQVPANISQQNVKPLVQSAAQVEVPQKNVTSVVAQTHKPSASTVIAENVPGSTSAVTTEKTSAVTTEKTVTAVKQVPSVVQEN